MKMLWQKGTWSIDHQTDYDYDHNDDDDDDDNDDEGDDDDDDVYDYDESEDEEENGDDDVTGRDLSCELLKAGSSQAGCTTAALIRSSRNSWSLKSQDLVLIFGLCPRGIIDMIKM